MKTTSNEHADSSVSPLVADLASSGLILHHTTQQSMMDNVPKNTSAVQPKHVYEEEFIDGLDYESETIDNIHFQCECGKEYSTEASLRFHRYECGKEPSFLCPHCEYRAKRRTTLNKHIASKH